MIDRPRSLLRSLFSPLGLGTLGILAVLGGTVVSGAAGEARAQAEGPVTVSPRVVGLEAGTHAGEMRVPLNKSQILKVDRRIADLLVGNPEVADVMPLTDRSIYVLGKELGSTNLTIYGPQRRLIAVVDIAVTPDEGGLRRHLHEIMPEEDIEVRAANGGLVLSGTVSTARQLDRALQVAESYAPDAVTNLMTVRGSQQVLLQVRVAEVQRTLTRELGLQPDITSEDFVFSTFDGLDPTNFAGASLNLAANEFTVDMLIDALEAKGAVKVLAEPNLVALSGDTATFLAGGEFPVPVARDDDDGEITLTIEWKQFGVSLGFTPTVLDNELINLRVAPEVSEIDRINSISINGTVIPGLSTRRAVTTVELRDGQSFAIAGLLQNDMTTQVRQLPGLGDIPLLGALFRSSSFQREETELVIIVTPRLVKPAAAGTLAAPTDTFRPPSEADLFLMGRVEGTPENVPVGSAAAALGARPDGGIAGPYGHILR